MTDIILRDLLAWEPRLELAHSIAGEPDDGDAGLDREISWAVTLRASMPILPPLRGHEVVILPDRIVVEAGIDIEELLREISGRGASAIVVDRAPRDSRGLTTLICAPMPPDLESDLNRLITEHRGAIYRSAMDLSRELTRVTQGQGDVEAVLQAAETFLQTPAVVVSRGGDLIARSPTGPAVHYDGRPAVGAGHQLVAHPLSHGATLWLGPVPGERQAEVRFAADRVASAVEQAQAHAEDVRPRGNARARALAGVLHQAGDDLPRLSAALGLPMQGTYLVALTPATGDRVAFVRELQALGTLHEAADLDGLAAMLIEASGVPARRPPGSGQRPPGREGRDAPDGRWVAVSQSVRGVDRIPTAYRQARFLGALAAEGLLPRRTLWFDRPEDTGIYGLLFSLWGSEALDRFTRDTIGPLIEHDRRGIFRHTLLAYLESGGSQVEAAARLGVHRNTLAYRLKQIGRLTGLDPQAASSHLALHMALIASRLPAPPTD